MKIVVIKYNAGNVRSVENAINRLNLTCSITDDPEIIKSADKVIFPGVGHAVPTMKYLKERKLDKVIKELKQPILGICLGQQLMCAHSEEGDVDCLNIFPIMVKKFEVNKPLIKVPQMGWNKIYNLKTKLFDNVKNEDFVYYVHSYYCENSLFTIATTDYGLDYSGALNKDNFYAVQFHPEKSADVGLKIIDNFLKI